MNHKWVLGWILVVGVGTLALLPSGCKSEEEPLVGVKITKDNVAAIDAVGKTEIPLPPPPKPMHRYDVEEGGVYYYLSEENKTLGYRYQGKNDKGEIVIERTEDNSGPAYTIACAIPCKLMKYDGGGRSVYRAETVIGAVFQDAMNGHLKAIRKARPTFVEPDSPTIPPSPTPAVTFSPMEEAPVVEEQIPAD